MGRRERAASDGWGKEGRKEEERCVEMCRNVQTVVVVGPPFWSLSDSEIIPPYTTPSLLPLRLLTPTASLGAWYTWEWPWRLSNRL